MKIFRVMVTVGIFFLLSQGSTVFLFQMMVSVARDQQLPVDRLMEFQTWIMALIMGSLGLLGLLFVVLVVTMLVKAYKGHIAASNGQWVEEMSDVS